MLTSQPSCQEVSQFASRNAEDLEEFNTLLGSFWLKGKRNEIFHGGQYPARLPGTQPPCVTLLSPASCPGPARSSPPLLAEISHLPVGIERCEGCI